MIKFSKIIVTILMALLMGCTRLPPHRPSDITIPKKTRNGTRIINTSHEVIQVMWWKKMHDKLLNQLIREALINNNQIHTARANILQAQAQLKEARFAWLPTLNASANGFIGGGWDSNLAPQGALAQSPVLRNLNNMHFKGYYGGFVPSYSLNILANINQNKFARASLNMQKAAYQSATLTIVSEMAGSYFMLLGQRQQLSEQRQLIHDLKKVRQLEWIRYKDGAGDLPTVTNLDQQIANNQANLSSIENSISQVENAMQVLLNRNPGPIVANRNISTFSIQGLIPARLPSAVLKNRPDIIMAKENLNLSESNLGLAYSNFFPTISLTGLLGGASIDLAHFIKGSTGIWIAQAAASMPILNGARYEQIQAAKEGYNAAYFSFVQTVKSAFADVDNSLTNQQKTNNMYLDKVKALQASTKGYKIILARYKAGAIDYRAVANAKLNVDNAALDSTLAKMQQLDSIVQVYQALAGGFEVCNI